MSRGWDEDGDQWLGTLFRMQFDRDIKSGRSQKFLRELEAELVAMQARGEGLLNGFLLADGVVNGYRVRHYGAKPEEVHGVCALGAVALKRCSPEQLEPWKNDRMDEEALEAGKKLGKMLGISCVVAAEIGEQNDNEPGAEWWREKKTYETNEERLVRMLAWTRGHLVKEIV